MNFNALALTKLQGGDPFDVMQMHVAKEVLLFDRGKLNSDVVGRPAMESQAREYVAAALEFEAAGRRDEAEKWLRRAAEDPLNSPTQPEEPWSEHYYYKAVALDRLGRRDDARALY